MKAQYKVNPKLLVEVEGRTQRELFDQLAAASEVFGESCCGVCGSKDIYFAKRTVDGNEYYEHACANPECGARLSIGLSKQKPGEMFPIRKLITKGPEKGKPSRKLGEFGPASGWTKYRGKSVEEDE